MARHRWQELAKNRFGAPCVFNFRENYFRKAGLWRNYRRIKPLGIHWLAMDHSRAPVRTDWGQKAITSWSLIPPGLSIDLWDRGVGT